jgi:hypothetical protein
MPGGRGVLTQAGYILGFPADTPESIARDIAIIQRELPIDIMEFFMLTPLPGSKDHQEMYLRGEPMDPDTNKYDAEHATAHHPRMTAAEWEDIYRRAWHLYYSPEHVRTLIKRAVASGIRTKRMTSMIFYFYASHAYEHVHPLQGGILRRKSRAQRRPGFPRQNPLSFFARRAREVFSTYVPGLWFFWRLERLRKRIEKDPASKTYTDLALSPVDDDEFGDELELYHATDGARRAATQAKARADEMRRIQLARAAS